MARASNQFRRLVIRPALMHLGLYSPAAENLLLGTALKESGLRALEQLGGGPARGVYQIEPGTHYDLFATFLHYRFDLRIRLKELRAAAPDMDTQLRTNLAYATGVARLIYYRRPEPLPGAGDIEGLAKYWKAFFNTSKGKGRWQDWVKTYKKYI